MKPTCKRFAGGAISPRHAKRTAARRRLKNWNGPRSFRSYFPTGGPDDPPDLPISPTDTGRNYANCGFWWGVLSSFPGNPVCASNNAGFSRRESLHIMRYRKFGEETSYESECVEEVQMPCLSEC